MHFVGIWDGFTSKIEILSDYFDVVNGCSISMNYGYDPQRLDPLRLQYGTDNSSSQLDRLEPSYLSAES